jgi:YgiT-type zinc finger domain-containing protein
MMRNWNLPDRCPVCGGKKAAGTTTFTVDFAFGVVVVRDVPATVCSLCGTDWIGDEVAAQLEKIVEDAKSKHSLVEITRLAS